MGLGATDFVFPSTRGVSSNAWGRCWAILPRQRDADGAAPSTQAFARHVGLPIEAILLSSYTVGSAALSPKLAPLVHFVAVDASREAVVLTCRGSPAPFESRLVC